MLTLLPAMLGDVSRSAPGPARGWLTPLILDLGCVLVFAIAGKGSHEAGRSEWVVLAIVWPFAVAVLVAHVGWLVRARDARRVWSEGVVVLGVTFVLGMVLRVVSGRGIAPGFLVVAAVFLALTMLGWRAALRLATRRRTRRGV
jgi:hypothetical protein